MTVYLFIPQLNSSIKELVKPLNIKSLNHSHITVILNHLKDKSTLPSEHKTSYPNLAEYFLRLRHYPHRKYFKGEYLKLKIKYF